MTAAALRRGWRRAAREVPVSDRLRAAGARGKRRGRKPLTRRLRRHFSPLRGEGRRRRRRLQFKCANGSIAFSLQAGSRRPRSGWMRGLPSVSRSRRPSRPDIDADEQEQPDDVDEMPVPGGRLEAEMLLRREVALDRRGPGRRSGRSCRRSRGSRGSRSP